jgi:hypothetical protein
MLNSKTVGVYIPSNKTFYYLEAGENYIGNSIDRIKKALIQRNLILPDLNTNYSKSSYSIIKYEEANQSGYNIEPIFLSQHIKALYQKNNSASGGNFK